MGLLGKFMGNVVVVLWFESDSSQVCLATYVGT